MALTTLARVKERLDETGSDWDALLNSLISEVTDDINARLGRIIEEATYTEYFDGVRDQRLYLRQGPLVSITSVNAVEYGNDGAGARTETLTAVVAADRLEGGLRTENYKGLGWIELNSSKWTPGQRNYKVVYVAGWSTVPEAILSVATSYVVALFVQREGTGLGGKSTGDMSADFLSPAQLDRWINRTIAPWKVFGVA